MTLKVKLHAFCKTLFAFFIAGCTHQGLHHANHFSTFFVDGDGVEVVDFNVAVRPDRMSHGAGILRELNGAQNAHIFNAFDRTCTLNASHVLAEFLIAKDGQALFQRQLKPVLAGNAIARPVVKVLVANHALNACKVGVSGSGRIGQNIFRVENVQALVFHSAHVEVAGGHNHEALQIEGQTKTGFVPGHAGHQGIHGVLCFV